MGYDDFAGSGESIHLSQHILRYLHYRGHYFSAIVIKKWDDTIPIWKTANELQLNGVLATQWKDITLS